MADQRFSSVFRHALREQSSRLQSFYTQEEISSTLRKLKTVPPDAQRFWKKELQQMCAARGLDAEALMQDESLLQMIPTRQELIRELLRFFYGMYQDFPRPADYMARLVHELDPGSEQVPVRTAILRRFVRENDRTCQTLDTSAVCEWAYGRMDAAQRERYDALDEAQQAIMASDYIDDSIFDAERMQIELSTTERMPVQLRLIMQCLREPQMMARMAASADALDVLSLDEAQLEELKNMYREAAGVLSVAQEKASGKSGKPSGKNDKRSGKKSKPSQNNDTPSANNDTPSGENGSTDDEAAAAPAVSDCCRILGAALAAGGHEDENDPLQVMMRVFKQADLEPDEPVRMAWQAYAQAAQINPETDADTFRFWTMVRDRAEAVEMLDEEAAAREAWETLCLAVDEYVHTFVTTGTYMSRTGRENRIAELLKYSMRDAREAKGRRWDILTICDDLSGGRFRNNNGKTKVYLYYFAMMYGMTLELPDPNPVWMGAAPEETAGGPDAADDELPEKNWRSIEENLFEDYYNDNLLRFLEEDYETPQKAAGMEAEPTGEGINYKNFAEIIYLYVLYHAGDQPYAAMNAGRRIDQAEKIIRDCKKQARKKKDQEETDIAWPGTDKTETDTAAPKTDTAGPKADAAGPKAEFTGTYKTYALTHLLSLTEPELIDELVARYEVLPRQSGKTSMAVAAEEITAGSLLEEAIELTELSYQGSAPDPDMSRVPVFEWKLSEYLREAYGHQDPQFIRLLDHIDERLGANESCLRSEDRVLMARILRILLSPPPAKNGARSGDGSISKDRLRELLKDQGIDCSILEISRCIRRMQDYGLKIHMDSRTAVLQQSDYDDPLLENLILSVRTVYDMDERYTGDLIKELERRTGSQDRISRSMLMTVQFCYYITLLNDTASIDTFPELYEDFTSTLDPILEEARYQPFSEKNLFDVYLLLSLYIYMVENGAA